MLTSLSVRDMVLIETAELGFQPGLNVLTGETGAGKSILLDSLGFVLGWRVRSGLVRSGAEQGEVTAEFDLPADHPARSILEEGGFDPDDGLIIRRTLSKDGRRQAWVNDRRATAETLRNLSATLVEIHGQQDDRGLLNPTGHRPLLDDYAGAAPALKRVAEAWEKRQHIAQRIADVTAAHEASKKDAEYLAHAVEEITAIDPQPEEEPQLDTRRRQLRAAEKIREDIANAVQATGSEGAEGALIQAMRWLEAAAPDADGLLDPVIDSLSRVLNELAEVSTGLDDVQSQLAGDPGELEEVEERLFAIRGLARKYQVTPEELPDLSAEFDARLQKITGAEDELAALAKDLKAVEADYATAAEALSKKRRAAAKDLDRRMKSELVPLKLDRAVFTTEIKPADPGPTGTDQVRFTAATNPGSPSGPIDKVASGGELSRFLLALKVCLSGRSDGLTLIFDEIDRGVGGATADAVGRRLQSLGQNSQVLVVTHSPQVASFGVQHWRIGKEPGPKGTVRTIVTPLSTEERREELARMLAGDVVTAEARAAANALLVEAG
ncbi:DNA repair protein RecN [Amaricoccus tamworthensis]|uniref:DNA repair protein RecN n=1 Tax=Amaricoccus tamworthensis TaxID=57002 RepID=UPI003C7C8E6E